MRLAPLLLGLVLLACSDRDASTQSSGVVLGNARVVRVVDGDTLLVDVDGTQDRVRLIGIDTPETKKEGTPVECFGPEASAFTESLLPEGTAIRLERDVEPRDQYDRLLAYAYRVDDGLFVNEEIVRRGYAQPLTIPPNVAHADEFVAAARAAEADDVGLWGGCSG